MTFVNLLIALILCTVVGAFTGWMLGGLVGDPYLAIIAGLLATIFVGNAHNLRIPQLAMIFSAVDINHKIPLRAIISSALASLAGSAAAVLLARVGELTSSVMVGALAGLFAGILMAMLMAVYDMNSRPTGRSGPNP
jgi:F0F1-type ATP synthase assembly protein I